MPTSSDHQIDELLKTHQEKVLLTPNLRLARHLKTAYAMQQQTAWPSPPIMPFGQWLDQLWLQQEDDASPICLSPIQELSLWQSVIKKIYPEVTSTDRYQHALLAQSAWTLLQSWMLDVNQLTSEEHKGFIYFKKLAQEFYRRCKQHEWITRCRRMSYLTSHLLASEHKATSENNDIVLINFDEFTPQQQAFLKQYAEHHQVCNAELKATVTHRHSKIICQRGEELMEQARWAYRLAKEHPNWQIACVVPNIKQTRRQVEHVFQQQFSSLIKAPYHENSLADEVNISLGLPLADYAVIQVAISALRIVEEGASWHKLQALWQSPYLQTAKEDLLCALCLQQSLLEIPAVALSIPYLIDAFANCPGNETLPGLIPWAQKWSVFFESLQKTSGKQHRSTCFADALKLLDSLGWPGYRTLNSEEHQVVQAFYKEIQSYCDADAVTERIDQSTFFEDLQFIVRHTVFQPQSKASAGVHVLGSLEAAGGLYDAIWISDLHAEQWPARANPHAFLPPSLQRDLNMPHASAERECAVSERLLQRLVNSAPCLVLSYAAFDQDKSQTASPLISTWPMAGDHEQASISTVAPAHYLSMLQKHSKRYPYIDLPLQVEKKNLNLKINNSLLTAQSQCPYQAFARYRLQAKPLQQPQYGISACEKGTLLHRALEYVWLEIKDQRQLIDLSESELTEKINTASRKSLTEYQQKIAKNHPAAPSPAVEFLMQIELQRLQKLLLNWLEIEKKRPYFKVVYCEKEQKISLQHLQINMRCDRIDQLDDGSYLLIDYKSSNADYKSWFGHRLRQLQLPLYAIAQMPPVGALAYAQLKPGKLKYQGVTEKAGEFKAIKSLAACQKTNKTQLPSTWNDCLQLWEKQINDVLQAFLTGGAEASPIDETICQFCSMHSLCRIEHHDH